MCASVMMFSRWHNFRNEISSNSIMPKPQKTAPMTKYSGKMVACQPAICAVQKSKPTMELTVNTSSVHKPQRTT